MTSVREAADTAREAIIRVAYSEWRGEQFAHYMVDTGVVWERRTLCGKSALGWSTDDLKEINCADCKVCNKAFAKLEIA